MKAGGNERELKQESLECAKRVIRFNTFPEEGFAARGRPRMVPPLMAGGVHIQAVQAARAPRASSEALQQQNQGVAARQTADAAERRQARRPRGRRFLPGIRFGSNEGLASPGAASNSCAIRSPDASIGKSTPCSMRFLRASIGMPAPPSCAVPIRTRA